MTANELADWLNNPMGYKMGEIATMLRQQQAEIEALKKELALQRLSDIGQEIEQEPVAWIKQNIETLEAELHFAKPVKYWALTANNPDIPLCIQPTQLKKASEK